MSGSIGIGKMGSSREIGKGDKLGIALPSRSQKTLGNRHRLTMRSVLRTAAQRLGVVTPSMRRPTMERIAVEGMHPSDATGLPATGFRPTR